MTRTLLMAILLLGCAHPQSAGTVEATAPSPKTSHFARELLETSIAVDLVEPPSPALEALVERAYAEAERVDAAFSDVRAGGQLARLNANAGLSPVKLDPDVFGLLQVVQEWSVRTHGAFDLTGRQAAPQLAAYREPRVGHRKLVLDARAQTAFLREGGAAVGLGEVARAYAVDRMARVLREAGRHDLRIAAGSALYAAGRGERGPWRAELRDPLHPDRTLGAMELEETAMRASFPSDPGAAGVAGTLVLAKRCTDAEALTDALAVLGPKEGFPIVHAAGGEGLFVGTNAAVVVTDTLARRIAFRGEVQVSTVPRADNF